MTAKVMCASALASLLVGCWAGDTVDHTGNHVVSRSGSVVVEGCTLDASQMATLASPSTRKVLSEVILLCVAIQSDATLAPAAADDRTTLANQVAAIHALGYRVSLATTIGKTWDVPASPADATKLVETVDVAMVASNELAFVQQTGADDVEVALPTLAIDGNVRVATTNLVRRIASSLRPAHHVGVFAPPSSQSPSELQGGDAFDLLSIASYVDAVRLMTLDYSCCGAPLGPTTDPGWVVDVARFNSDASTTHVDVAYPLYGWDTTIAATQTQSPVTYAEAQTLATTTHANVARGPTGAPYFDYAASDGAHHEVWFDDATSTLRALHAWDANTLPPSTGVVFYGLGAEDPHVWDAIAKELP